MPGDELGPQEDEPESFTLVVAIDGPGEGIITSDPDGIDCGGACTTDYPNGAEITLAALPSAGSVFIGWSEPCSGAGATCELTMSTNHTIVATFGLTGEDEGGDDRQNGDEPQDDEPLDDEPAPYGNLVGEHSGSQDGEFRHGFGASVDISGDQAVVSAPGGDGASGDGLFFFELDGQEWEEAAHFDIPDEITASITGWSVALSDEYAAANYLCPHDTEEAHPSCPANGFFILERQAGGWEPVTRFEAEEAGLPFGWGLAFSGDYLFAGASEDEFAQDGVVYVYRRVDANWQLEQTLREVDEEGRRFGNELAAEGEYLAVGSETGAHVYQLGADGQWEYQQTLDVPSGDDFGEAFRDVAMGDGWLASSWAQTRVYELRDGAWTFTGEMVGPGEAAFGGDHLLLGFSNDSTMADRAGSVRVFDWTGESWEMVNELFAADPAPGRRFGAAVAATAEYAVIGADAGPDRDSIVGSAYFFHNEPAD